MNFYEQLFSRGRTTGEGMTHFERLFAAKFGGSPPPEVREYTGAVPVTITADGTPLIDYLISGNMIQSGTPTRENPVMPQGCGKKTRNLYPLDESKLHVGRIENDGTIDYVVGTLTVGTDSVTYEANTTWRGFYTDLIQVNENEKLTFSPNSSDSAWSCSCYDENDNFLGKASAQSIASIRIFALLTGTKKVRMSVTSSNTTYTILKPMLNTGITALSYEPYGFEISISSASTTTPIYLGEVPTTRKIRKATVNITGTVNLSNGNKGGVHQFSEASLYAVQGPGYCDIALYDIARRTTGMFYVNQQNAIFVGDSTDTLETLKEKWNGATFWYVLAEPETGVVNEPLCKIGDYADTLSKSQAGVSIPTNNGSTTVDVNTTVKPSEVYIKYMG